MTLRSRFAFITAALVLGAVSLPSFASSAPDPAWLQYSWDIPILQGEYLATNGGTLGSLSIGFTSDANHTFGGSTFFYDNAGKSVTLATGGQVHYNDDATVIATGVIAWTDLSTYALSGGPCRGCADHPRQQSQTPDVAKFEWTGPRAGRFTVNGQTQTMVEATSGLPLVAPTDFSGEWIMVWRQHYEKNGADKQDYSFIRHVKLVPVGGERTYATVVDTDPPNSPPYGSFSLPRPGARLYDIVCNDIASGCPMDFAFQYPDNYSNLATFWFDDKDVGGIVFTRVAGAGGARTYTVADTGTAPVRAYGRRDFITTRLNSSPAFTGYSEMALFRIAPQTLAGFQPPPAPGTPGF